MSEIDHEYTNDIVCPYCGEELPTYGEDYDDDESCMSLCPNCYKRFIKRKHYITSIKFSVEKLPCANGEGVHEWSHWIGETNGAISRVCKRCRIKDYKAETRG